MRAATIATWVGLAGGPSSSLLLLLLGAVLALVEVNRPGRVVPGAAGLLLCLWGARGLWHGGVTAPGVVLLASGAGLLLAQALGWVRMPWLPLAGAVAFAAGLGLLPRSAGMTTRAIGLGGGAVLGAALAGMGRLAALARANKEGHRRAGEEARRTGKPERWEPEGGVD